MNGQGQILLKEVPGMDWVLFEDCFLVRKNKGLSLHVGGMKQMATPKRPAGSDINPELVAGKKKKEFEGFLNSTDDGVFQLGCLRPGVGGAFVIPFENLDLGIDSGRVLDNLQKKFGDINPKNQAMPGVVRGLGAPGTSGVIDGGGAGILNKVPAAPEDIEFHCLSENFGEIGIQIQKEEKIRVGFFSSLDEVVEKEWAISWEQVPSVSLEVDIGFLPVSDTIIFANHWRAGCALSFESENASVEILRLHYPTWSLLSLSLPSGLKLSFRDLEHNNAGKRLNRSIAVVCKGSRGLFALFYKAGEFVEDLAIPLTGDCYELLTNSKSKKLISLIFKQ